MKESRLEINPNAHYTMIDDTAIVLDGQRGKYLGLNETASRILDLLARGRTTGQVLETMSEEYDIEPEALRRDIARFIAEMEAMGLLTAAGS